MAGNASTASARKHRAPLEDRLSAAISRAELDLLFGAMHPLAPDLRFRAAEQHVLRVDPPIHLLTADPACTVHRSWGLRFC